MTYCREDTLKLLDGTNWLPSTVLHLPAVTLTLTFWPRNLIGWTQIHLWPKLGKMSFIGLSTYGVYKVFRTHRLTHALTDGQIRLQNAPGTVPKRRQRHKNPLWCKNTFNGTCICPMHAVSCPIIQTTVCHVRRLLLTPSSYLSPVLKYLTCNLMTLNQHSSKSSKVKGHGVNRREPLMVSYLTSIVSKFMSLAVFEIFDAAVT